jgi:hypothetical protein
LRAGLVNYDAHERRKIRGAKDEGDREGRLGYKGFDEVILRDNQVVL